MANKKWLEQTEVNHIVASRLQRERDRLTKEFEARLKRCMAAVHLTLYQEMCALKQEITAETKDTLLSAMTEDHSERPKVSTDTQAAHTGTKGGEKQ